MRLTELDPKLTDTQLRFRCPLCQDHFIVIPLAGPHAWQAHGTVENLSVTPSIAAETKPRCFWHGFITGGEMQTLGDSRLTDDVTVS